MPLAHLASDGESDAKSENKNGTTAILKSTPTEAPQTSTHSNVNERVESGNDSEDIGGQRRNNDRSFTMLRWKKLSSAVRDGSAIEAQPHFDREASKERRQLAHRTSWVAFFRHVKKEKAAEDGFKNWVQRLRENTQPTVVSGHVDIDGPDQDDQQPEDISQRDTARERWERLKKKNVALSKGFVIKKSVVVQGAMQDMNKVAAATRSTVGGSTNAGSSRGRTTSRRARRNARPMPSPNTPNWATPEVRACSIELHPSHV